MTTDTAPDVSETITGSAAYSCGCGVQADQASQTAGCGCGVDAVQAGGGCGCGTEATPAVGERLEAGGPAEPCGCGCVPENATA